MPPSAPSLTVVEQLERFKFGRHDAKRTPIGAGAVHGRINAAVRLAPLPGKIKCCGGTIRRTQALALDHTHMLARTHTHPHNALQWRGTNSDVAVAVRQSKRGRRFGRRSSRRTSSCKSSRSPRGAF